MQRIPKSEPVPLRQDEHGVICVGGTRVTLDTVLAAHRQGRTAEQIAEDYPVLELADVYAAIAYYLRHRAEVDEYLERQHQLADEVQREMEKHFPRKGVRERLESRLR